MKKTNDELTISLTKNPDILSWAAQHKTEAQKVVGFALETTNGLDYAKGKLKNKQLDAIVLNVIGAAGVGFGTETNAVTYIDKNNKMRSFELQAKTTLARAIIEAIYAES
jgi:phosphopantothenoylcysteine decarboxylase/phosphopantothenate--cysteine ligase